MEKRLPRRLRRFGGRVDADGTGFALQRSSCDWVQVGMDGLSGASKVSYKKYHTYLSRTGLYATEYVCTIQQ